MAQYAYRTSVHNLATNDLPKLRAVRAPLETVHASLETVRTPLETVHAEPYRCTTKQTVDIYIY